MWNHTDNCGSNLSGPGSLSNYYPYHSPSRIGCGFDATCACQRGRVRCPSCSVIGRTGVFARVHCCCCCFTPPPARTHWGQSCRWLSYTVCATSHILKPAAAKQSHLTINNQTKRLRFCVFGKHATSHHHHHHQTWLNNSTFKRRQKNKKNQSPLINISSKRWNNHHHRRWIFTVT